ncbi:hypothetical protein K2224_15070 [Streptomyces sp. BHT-5-2]|uniref:hypothetical protein n=1 Tax=Streptomyces sp. BHT-5-2 TaxID=2866715 RepID=UPI001C8EC7AC|nr:hypothetical protein [Streptomyces sp. BHT-5-2]QZL04334.1 hypothetical protein K2224_15070 [Streptomyces sp. BHT-5-2]
MTVPRFSPGHVDALPAQHPEVDSTQLRSIRKGRRSPLAVLATERQSAAPA